MNPTTDRRREHSASWATNTGETLIVPCCPELFMLSIMRTRALNWSRKAWRRYSQRLSRQSVAYLLQVRPGSRHCANDVMKWKRCSSSTKCRLGLAERVRYGTLNSTDSFPIYYCWVKHWAEDCRLAHLSPTGKSC